MIYTMYILEKLQMSIQTSKIIHINNEHIFGATTLKDITLPEKNNTALHVCIDMNNFTCLNRHLQPQKIS